MHAARYLHYPKLYPIDLFMAKVLGQQKKEEGEEEVQKVPANNLQISEKRSKENCSLP